VSEDTVLDQAAECHHWHTVTLHRAHQITESHNSIPRLHGAVQSVCTRVYLELGEAALQCSRLP